MTTSAEDTSCTARYYDGRTARGQLVALTVDHDQLRVRGDAVALDIPLVQVEWPERTRHGALILRLPEGATAQVEDREGFATLMSQARRRDSLVVYAQRRWGMVLAALLALLGTLLLALQVGVPAASGWLAARTPAAFERSLGQSVLRVIDERFFEPSTLTEERKGEIRAQFMVGLRDAGELDVVPDLLFRASRIGPNALALPGSIVIMTDELIKLADSDDAVFGVLAHEYGHVRLRHSVRGLYESLALTALASALLGDFAGVMAAAPVALTTLSYSRAREREADAEALRLLQATGRDPDALARLFERLSEQRATAGRQAPPISFSSHPADAERIEFFRAPPKSAR